VDLEGTARVFNQGLLTMGINDDLHAELKRRHAPEHSADEDHEAPRRCGSVSPAGPQAALPGSPSCEPFSSQLSLILIELVVYLDSHIVLAYNPRTIPRILCVLPYPRPVE
jgi:hypothetical protein